MGSAPRKIRRAAHLLIIAAAVMGMEIDVVSNPFTPDFVLSRIYAALGISATGSAAGEPSSADDAPAREPGARWVPQAHLRMTLDETVAIRSNAGTSGVSHWFLPWTSSPLPSVHAGWVSRAYSPPTPRELALTQLCRFLC